MLLRELLHRDLKPANVMLDGRGQVRITDFGLACLIKTAAKEHVFAGTPFYMAPEQLAGEPVTVRSDLYSLGLVLYEIFTGQGAFPANSLEQLERVRKGQSARRSVADGRGSRSGRRAGDPAIAGTGPAASPLVGPGGAGGPARGDPLQAAVAAGETPSPEMVAAARQPGRLPAAVGGFCLAGIVAALVAVAILSDRTTLVGQAALKSPRRSPSTLAGSSRITAMSNRRRTGRAGFGTTTSPRKSRPFPSGTDKAPRLSHPSCFREASRRKATDQSRWKIRRLRWRAR